MSFLDEFILHYLDNFFYIIYKEEEWPCRNETTKNVYPAGEVFNTLNNKLLFSHYYRFIYKVKFRVLVPHFKSLKLSA